MQAFQSIYRKAPFCQFETVFMHKVRQFVVYPLFTRQTFVAVQVLQFGRINGLIEIEASDKNIE